MTRSVDARAVRILSCLYSLEAAGLLVLVGIYKAPVYGWALLSTKAGAAVIAGGIGLIASAWLLVWQTVASGSSRGRAIALALATNLLSGVIGFGLLEASVRIAARRTRQGTVVGSVALRPTWPELVEQSRAVLAGVAPWGTWDASYFVYDRELGWTVGPNRRSPDGLYFSSVEGIRSGGPNVRMADLSPRFHVALVGDSNAFSFEVPFEDSWGNHLQRLLGDEAQVLNFGVDGYGIDQMYLRYERDVRPWKPQVVVIGFIEDDLWRTMAVYPVVSFGWPGYLVKPRFAVESGELRLLNVPLPTPDEILRARHVDQLPFAEYDLGYGTTDWSWRAGHGLLALRFLTSAFPRWPISDPRVSEEATKTLNTRLLTRFVEHIEQAGAAPIVIPLPSPRSALLQDTLSLARVNPLDVTTCLAAVPADRRRVSSGHHYTGPANRALAECTAPAVEWGLGRAASVSPSVATLHPTERSTPQH